MTTTEKNLLEDAECTIKVLRSLGELSSTDREKIDMRIINCESQVSAARKAIMLRELVEGEEG